MKNKKQEERKKLLEKKKELLEFNSESISCDMCALNNVCEYYLFKTAWIRPNDVMKYLYIHLSLPPYMPDMRDENGKYMCYRYEGENK